jgi:hypothetical protein
MISAFAEETDLSSWGMDLKWARGDDREGHFTVFLRHVPGPYDVWLHFPDPEEDPHELTVRVLKMFEVFPSHWPDVEFLELYDAPDRGPDVAGRGWRRRGGPPVSR